LRISRKCESSINLCDHPCLIEPVVRFTKESYRNISFSGEFLPSRGNTFARGKNTYAFLQIFETILYDCVSIVGASIHVWPLLRANGERNHLRAGYRLVRSRYCPSSHPIAER